MDTCIRPNLSVEQLEERLLLAGDVSFVYFTGGGFGFDAGDLVVLNDNDFNDPTVTGDQDITLTEGSDGTLTAIANSGEQFDIYTYDGNNLNLVADDQVGSVSGPAGLMVNDVVFNPQNDPSQSQPSAVNDTVGVDATEIRNVTPAQNLEVYGNDQADEVTIQGTTPQDDLIVMTHGGGDTVSIDGGVADNVTVETGDGPDDVSVIGTETNAEGDLIIRTGENDDFVVLEDLIVRGDTIVEVDGGDDTVIAHDNVFGDGPEDSLEARFGTGDDFLEYGGNDIFAGSALVDGGAGASDEMQLVGEDDCYHNTTPVIVNWEIEDPEDDSLRGDCHDETNPGGDERFEDESDLHN